VEGQIIASGEAESKIADGSLEPVIWSPASSLWGRLLNFDADRPLAPDDNPSIVRTPLVIAMWEPFAKALGWPREPIGFEQVISLARSNQGFAEFGHPRVRAVQARAYQSGLLHLWPLRRGGRVLRRHGQEGGAHRRGRA
jgi:hypothetical protein